MNYTVYDKTYETRTNRATTACQWTYPTLRQAEEQAEYRINILKNVPKYFKLKTKIFINRKLKYQFL